MVSGSRTFHDAGMCSVTGGERLSPSLLLNTRKAVDHMMRPALLFSGVIAMFTDV